MLKRLPVLARSWLNVSWLNLSWFSFIWLSFILAIYLSWFALAQVNFLYPIWYEYAGIKQNIEQFAPQNQYRKHFEHTDDATRKTLFAGIVQAIHQGGHDGQDNPSNPSNQTDQSLRQLHYQVTLPSAFAPVTLHVPLLHNAEITHLTDVANLISRLKTVGLALLMAWSALLLGLLWRNTPFVSQRTVWLNVALGLGAIGLLVSALGAKTVFYQLHVWVFPPQHPWFFYYQDSLMSTLMKAPDLFAYIGATLLMVALLLFSALTFVLRALFKRLKTRPKTL